MLVQYFFGVMDCVVSLVFKVNHFSSFSVFILHFFSLVDHIVDLFLVKPAGTLNSDGLFPVGGSVLRAHVHNTVSIDIECDFDLRNSSWCWWDSR